MSSTETTTSDDIRRQAEAVMGGLIGPGGPFELAHEDVLGTSLPLFANRHRALHDVLSASVQHGERPYVVTADRVISFGEHAHTVASVAQGLREEHGVEKGDRVGISAANCPEWIPLFWATVSIGAIAVGLNAWWSPRETRQAIEQVTPRLIFADAKRAAQLSGSSVPVLSFEDDLRRLGTAHPDAPLPTADVAEDDAAVILFTSGTSGRAKGAVHTHRNLLSVVEYHRLNDSLAAAFGDPTDPRDRSYLLVLPLFHIASLHNLAVPRLATGSTVALHEGTFDVDRVLRLIEQRGVTNWGAVPTMAKRMLEHGDLSSYDLSSMRAFSLSSAPSSTAFQNRLREGLPFASALVDSYGLTESCTAISVATPMDLIEAPGSLGRPVIGAEVQIRDSAGQPVGPGVEGEICVRSAYNMLGYWGDPESTAAAVRADRWLHTGDMGEVDEQGRLRLSSRRSDLIIRGGENVYPAEIEAVLAEDPRVSESIVLGVPHDDLGQEVAVVLVPRDGDDAGDPAAVEALIASLREHVAAHLAYFKVPAHWRVTTTPLPRNATGKIKRAQVAP